MKIALVCSLVLGTAFVGKACDLCAMEPEKMATTVTCMSDKISNELKEKLMVLNKDGLPLPEFIKKNCDAQTDFKAVLENTLSEEEMGSMKKAYDECAAA
uniref:Putative secreted protein n=1 Tax=Ixodes ricinus TaxID=34613 RepID=V5HBU5_IXORI